jgi:DNA-binding CsgD family transcriptional regulator
MRLVVRHLCEATHCLLLLEEQSAVQPKVLEALRLTRREAEVLHWVAEGKTNEEIGMLLGLSPRTVSKHLEHIYDKLGVRTRTEAVRLVVERGLLRP